MNGKYNVMQLKSAIQQQNGITWKLGAWCVRRRCWACLPAALVVLLLAGGARLYHTPTNRWLPSKALSVSGQWSAHNQTSPTTAQPTTAEVTLTTPVPAIDDFEQMLNNYASSKKEILISIVDSAFAEMTLNMYLSCLVPQHVSNYLVIALDGQLCKWLARHDVTHCYTYTNTPSSGKPSNYDSPQFVAKMNSRTDVIIRVLAAGFSLFHTDVDMICFKNPFDHFECPRGRCDIATMIDDGGAAGGCDLIHPSAVGVYRRMKELEASGRNDQALLQQALAEAKKSRASFVQRLLPTQQFPNALDYYEKPRRYFAGPDTPPCPECVVVQNNWIVSLAAKVYRAKELHHWMVDIDQYYSSASNKYLVYKNPVHVTSTEQEISALKDALAVGQILNRTVVLPEFHTGDKPCPLNCIMRLDTFDPVFKGKYREHTFLTHPLVPDAVKASRSPVYYISRTSSVDTELQNLGNYELSKTVESVDWRSRCSGSQHMDDKCVWQLFGARKESVLELLSLDHVFEGFSDSSAQREFDERWTKGFKRGGYRQY